MASPLMKLDTLSYAKKLIEAGCAPRLAEVHAAAQQDVLVEISQDYLSQFATKQDLLQFATKQDLLQFATKQDLLMMEQRIEANLDAKFEPKFAAIDKKFAAIDEKFDAIDARFAAIDARCAAIDARVAAIDKKFSAIDLKFAAIDRQFDALNARFDIFEHKMKNMVWQMTGILGGLVVAGVVVLDALTKLH